MNALLISIWASSKVRCERTSAATRNIHEKKKANTGGMAVGCMGYMVSVPF